MGPKCVDVRAAKQRRRLLLASAAGLLPLALCLCEAPPAFAGAVTVNPVQTTTYDLNPAANPITFGASTNINVSGGNGVVGSPGTIWTLTDDGSIQGGLTYSGIFIDSGGHIINNGVISGDFGGVTVLNGSITNHVTGIISSGRTVGAWIAGAGVLTNYGLMSGNTGAVVFSGSLINKHGATIRGVGTSAAGASVNDATVVNAGLITGTQDGVIMGQNGSTASGSLTNQAAGQMSGGIYGIVSFDRSSSTITNAGQISTTGSYGAAIMGYWAKMSVTNSGTIDGGTAVGLDLREGGSLTNGAGGRVQGNTAVLASIASATITNAGKISGYNAIELDQGGTITNRSSGLIAGRIIADAPVSFSNGGTWQLAPFGSYTSEGGSLSNTGMIEGAAGVSAAQFYEVSGPAVFHNGASGATGTINLANGIVGDALLLEQPFVAASNHSQAVLDAFLGGPGSQADELELGVGSTGKTLIQIRNTNSGAGALNAAGIVLVTGASSASNFALDPKGHGYNAKDKGILDGLYLYTLQFSSGTVSLVGQPGPTAHQLATSLTAGQTILSQTGFQPSGAGIGMSGQDGFGFTGPSGQAGADERPMFWTAAVNTLSSDLMQQGRFIGRPGLAQTAAPPALRLSSIQSSAGMDTGYDQGLAMLKGGADLYRSAHFSFGVGTAYVQSDQRFTDGGTAMFYEGMVWGGYANWHKGSAFIDASFKSAMLKARYQAPFIANANPATSLTATGLQVDSGFSLSLSPHWSLSPVASAAATRTSMADLRIASELASFKSGYTGFANAGVQLAGSGKLGGGYSLSTLVTAKVWDRFGDNAAYLASLGGSALVDRISGVSGEVAAELRLARGQGFYGFVQASARAGQAQTSTAALAGFALRW